MDLHLRLSLQHLCLHPTDEHDSASLLRYRADCEALSRVPCVRPGKLTRDCARLLSGSSRLRNILQLPLLANTFLRHREVTLGGQVHHFRRCVENDSRGAEDDRNKMKKGRLPVRRPSSWDEVPFLTYSSDPLS